MYTYPYTGISRSDSHSLLWRLKRFHYLNADPFEISLCTEYLRAQRTQRFSACMSDDNAVYWLILGTGISTLVSAVFYIIQGACSQVLHNLRAHCWQYLASRLDVRAESFEKLSNGVVYPRILQQLGLNSYKVIYLHDANAQTGDCVQWGWMRLPTKSWMLTFLSFSGVSHYAYIHHDLRSMEIVGPAAGIRALVAVSSTAATSRLAPEDLTFLKEAMGMGESMTHADRSCVQWEKCFLVGLFIFGALLGLLHLMLGLCQALGLSVLAFSLFVFAVYWKQCCCGTCNIVLDELWSLRSQIAQDENSMSFVEEPLLYDHESFDSGDVMAADSTATIGSAFNASEVEAFQENTINLVARVNVLTARSHFYEPVRSFEVAPVVGTPLIQFKHSPQVVAVKARSDLISFLSARTEIPIGAALHICVYNPMIDPYLIEICENFKKGVDVENLLMVVLPHLHSLSCELNDSSRLRNHTQHTTQYVTTSLDFEVMLMQMACGIFRNLVFVLPVDGRTSDSPVDEVTWQACCHVYGQEFCHWRVGGAELSS